MDQIIHIIALTCSTQPPSTCSHRWGQHPFTQPARVGIWALCRFYLQLELVRNLRRMWVAVGAECVASKQTASFRADCQCLSLKACTHTHKHLQDGDCPLQAASLAGHLAIVTLLLEKGRVDVNQAANVSSYSCCVCRWWQTVLVSVVAKLCV